jgi:hypothetical protein
MKKQLVAILLAGYLLGIRGGHVALWKQDDPQPLRVFPWSANMMPLKIRKALERGIYVEADSDIGKLIQEMIS